MNIQGILANLMGSKLTPTVRTEPGVTYGPAVSLVSRTPIDFDENMPANRQGEYFPGTNRIHVNPNSKGFPTSQVLKHEQIHAILSQLPQGGAPQTTSAPGFMDIARRIQGTRAGDVQDEVPAYMAQSPTSQFYGVSDDQRNAYVQGLAAQLQKLDPGLAARFQRLSK
jgi:hypothetical protein